MWYVLNNFIGSIKFFVKVNMQTKILNILSHELMYLRDWCARPRQPEDGYKIGLLLLIAGGMIKWLFDLPAFTQAVLWGGAIILVGGLCWELFRKFRSLLKNATLGAIILGIPSSAIVASIAIVIAEHLVNEATLTSPSYFKNSTNIIALLAVPFVLSFFFAIGLIIYNICRFIISGVKEQFKGVIFSFRNDVTANPSDNNANELGRMIATILLSISIFWGIDNINGGPGSSLQAFVKHMVVLADHHPYVRCTNVTPDEMYLLIDDNLLSVATTKPDISFSQRTCNPE